MASYYVDPVAGNNANAGTVGAAKLTLIGFNSAPAITLVDGDTIVLVNSAAHEWPLTANEYSITKSVTIRGGTAVGANAVTTISSTSDSTARRYVQASAASTIVFENIIFDTTATTGDADAYDLLRYNGATSLMQFRGCSFLASGLAGVISGGARRLFNQVTNPGTGVDTIKFFRCYFQNASSFVTLNATNDNIFDECVFINTIASISSFTKTAAGAAGGIQYTHCTVYQDVGAGVFGFPITFGYSGTGAVVDVHSNLLWQDSTNGTPLFSFMRDANGPAASTGTRGFNVILGGPNISAGDVHGTGGLYQNSWDADLNDAAGIDAYATDTVAFGIAAASVFLAPTNPYAWDTVNGLTITLPKNLRPLLYQTAGSGGSVPGALPAASTDYGIALSTSNSAPEPGDTFTITVTATNSGAAATAVIMTALIPAGLTFVSATPSLGLYNSLTGTWTLGTLSASDTQLLLLEVTVDADQAGNTIVMTATTTSGDPATDTNSANNSASLSLPIPVDDDTDPIETVFLDVAPIFAPVLLAEVNAIIRTRRNRLPHYDQRKDFERRMWREYGSRRITVAPSTTVSIITAIERADFFVMEATGDLEVSTSDGSTDSYFPAASRVALLAGSFTTLKLRNPSATAAVDALLVVID